MLREVPMGPPDKILGLNELFKADSNPLKVSLGVGAYRGDDGKPLVLNVVHDESLLRRISAVQSLSGTGACRIAGEFFSRFLGEGTKIYMPNPTWPNHIPIMKNAGLEPAQYSYYDADGCKYNHTACVRDIENAPNGSVFLMHACAHNPTGCDPSKEEWDELSKLFKRKEHIVFFDSAYQGFASGNSESDAYAIRKFVEDGHEILLAQSFAKNFGLYGERIGTLSVVCKDEEERKRVDSQLKLLVRPMYSNPPVHGARIVQSILSDIELKNQWIQECKDMADRMHAMREKHSVYCTDDGRISIAGINTGNVAHIAQAIHDVTK
eukprot:GSChrysophyteH1.ASY1.ANO1.2276.1 assembled CDS